jgi:hypothetical protein
MELDDELRRMFAASGDKLDVPVRADAEQTIVAGARRLRRRRLTAMAAGGAAAVVTVVAVGIALALPRQESMPPAVDPPTTTSSTTTEPSVPDTGAPPPTAEAPPMTPPSGGDPQPNGDDPPEQTAPEPPPEAAVTGRQLGPSGFMALELGMSVESAMATGMVSDEPYSVGCQGRSLLIDGQASGTAYFGDKGLQIIAPTVAVHTVDGVSVGWTTDQFVARYPDEQGAAENGEAFLSVAGNSDAIYRVIFANDRVSRIQLQMVDMICD